MEPEDRLHGHMKGGGQVVAATDVTEFVSENRIQLCWSEPLTIPSGRSKIGRKTPKTPGSTRPGEDIMERRILCLRTS